MTTSGAALEVGHGARRRSRRVRRLLALASVLALWATVDACVVEPRWLEVTRITLPRGGVAAAPAAPLSVAIVSDLHTRGLGAVERAVVSALREAKPDVVAVTGDVVDHGELEAARPVLAALVATAPRLGVWVISGNWEHWRPPAISPETFYEGLGARFLDDRAAELTRDGSGEVWIAGLDWESPPSTALRDVPRGARLLVLSHAPDVFPKVAALAARNDSPLLVVAGHTHGGQARLPFLGALWTPPGSGPYVAGSYTSGDGRMYVSRGVGTSVLPVRFFCRPELPLLRWH